VKLVLSYRLSAKGAKFITNPPHEGLSLRSYPDSGGVWTIGFGTTMLNGYPVSEGMEINPPVAWALFYGKIQEFLDYIERLIKVPLNQNQIDALASLTYNIGKTGFSQSSLLTYINSNKPIVEDLFTRWNKIRVKGVLTPSKGLIDRRKREYKLFMTEDS
jgi:lysozyme